MAKARTVRPTDLVALVAYDGKVYPNEAITHDRIGTKASPHPLETALEQWFSFATGRHTWISVRGATLRGLMSARRRGSNAAWEIDCLIDAAEDDPGVLMSLLDQAAADAGRAGAEKLFLRIESGSPLLKTACRSGFTAYLTEQLLAASGKERHGSNGKPTTLAAAGLRRWNRNDAYPTYQLYNRWTPEPVRRLEAATFHEWQAARQRMSPPRGTHQRVREGIGSIVGLLRTAAVGEVGRFDLMADPSSPALLEELLDAALSRLHEQSVHVTLVPEFAGGLRERLEQRGFAQQDEFTLLARRTTKTAQIPKATLATPAQTFPA